MKFSDIWLFRNFQNALLGFVGMSGVSYIVYTAYNEKKFSSPIVAEALKILTRSSKATDILGYPISYTYSLANRCVIEKNEVYYAIKVAGPLYHADVELSATWKPAKDVYSYGKPLEKELEVQNILHSQKEKRASLAAKIASEKVTHRRKVLEIELKEQEYRIEELEKELQLVRVEQKKIQDKFYIPEKEIYQSVITTNTESEITPLDENAKLWGISDLVITLPSRGKLFILPDNNQANLQIMTNAPKGLLDYPTYQNLQERMKISLEGLSEDEVLAYSKMKTMFMYQKHGSYRTVLLVFCIGGLVMYAGYRKSNVLRTIRGTVIEQDIQNMLMGSSKMREIMKNMKRPILIDRLAEGGLSKDRFDCQLRLYGLKQGKAYVSGTFDEKAKKISYSRLEVERITDEGKETINLLK